MIKNLKMFDGEFHGARTAYSSSSIFIALLTNPKVKYDHEVIGSAIFPNGFGTIDPPGPGFGFGSIVLKDDEENGKVSISGLKVREDEDGKLLTKKAIKESLKEYFDAFFIVDKVSKSFIQVHFNDFYKKFDEEIEYSVIHFCEFEPNEDEDEDEDE